MAYREFKDQWGTEWKAWETVPTGVERRGTTTPPSDTPKFDAGRRKRENSAEVRLKMRPGWEGGWLSFESAKEKRRLVPLPADWDKATDEQLNTWLTESKSFPKRGSFIE